MASLGEVLRALASGALHSLDYTDNLLARVARRDQAIRAFVRIDAPLARNEAYACDQRQATTDELGPLHGLPVGVKDIFDTQGLPTARGSLVYAERRPPSDAVVVQRLRAAGAFVLGKTATTEFAFMSPAETRNPWNLQHTPGGSSAGSAAAVAAGFVHASIGTQTNGSIIRPAAFCGVVGFKPTAGLLPFGGGFCFSPTLDQVGTFARSVADVALFTAPLAEGEPFPARVDTGIAPPVLGVITDFPWVRLDEEGRGSFLATLQRLARAGARLQPLELPPAYVDANLVHRTIMLHEGARQHHAVQSEHRARLSRALNEALDEGRRISQPSYGEMLARRAALTEIAADILADCDAVVCPPAPGGAPRRLDVTGDPGFCTLWSLLGVPSITIPTGLTASGVPLGMQFATAAGSDARLLAMAGWAEAVLGLLPRPQ